MMIHWSWFWKNCMNKKFSGDFIVEFFWVGPFFCAFDDLEFDVKVPQIMQCVVFHKVLVGLEILNQQTRLKKRSNDIFQE
jgi:hypothetical protein